MRYCTFTEPPTNMPGQHVYRLPVSIFRRNFCFRSILFDETFVVHNLWHYRSLLQRHRSELNANWICKDVQPFPHTHTLFNKSNKANGLSLKIWHSFQQLTPNVAVNTATVLRCWKYSHRAAPIIFASAPASVRLVTLCERHSYKSYLWIIHVEFSRQALNLIVFVAIDVKWVQIVVRQN